MRLPRQVRLLYNLSVDGPTFTHGEFKGGTRVKQSDARSASSFWVND